MNRISKTFIIFASLILSLATIAGGQTRFDFSKNSVQEFDVNGLKVLVRQRPTAQTVAAGLFFRGGTRNLTAKTAGIENMALSVATEGGETYPRAELRRELARTGSSIGAQSAMDYSVISFVSTKKNFNDTWKMFADVSMKPAFEKADIERIRALALNSLRSRNDDPDSFLDSTSEEVLHEGHPYANDPGGTIETVSSFTQSQLRKYHGSLMQTSRMLLVVVGNVDPVVVKKMAGDSFGKLPVGSYSDKSYPRFDFSKSTLKIEQKPLRTNYIKGTFEAPSIGKEDYFPMRVAVTILRNRLFQEVRQKRSLSYAPGATMGSLGANSGNIYVTAVDANRTMSVMLNEVRRIRDEKVSENDIINVVGGFLTDYYTKAQRNVAQANNLAKFELLGGGWENSFEYFAGLQKVTPDTVQAASRKVLSRTYDLWLLEIR